MFEAPERVTAVISEFIDDCTRPAQAANPPAS
jgi:hypothetical protein